MNRDTILEHMARTLFVTSFAEACEDRVAYSDFDPRDQAAGAGEDWFDTVTDPTPPQAVAKARDIAIDFEALNGRTLENAGEQWAAIPGHCYRTADDAEAFGFRLAMQALGHGVGLWDDVNDPSEVGYATFYVGYTEFYAWDWI
jgi:hypothetical protein